MTFSSPLANLFHQAPGPHCCSWEDSDESSLSGITGFLSAAQPEKHRIICLANSFLATRILGILRTLQRPPESLILAGAMQVLNSRDPFLQGAHLSGRRVAAFLQETERKALAEGLSGLRCVFEMAWLGGGTAGLTDLKEFEWALHDFHPAPETRFLCHYDLSRFPADFLGSILEMHQVLTYGESGGPNPYFTLFRSGPDGSAADQTFRYRHAFLPHWLATETPPASEAHGSTNPPLPAPGTPMAPAPGSRVFPKALETLFARDLPPGRVFTDLLEEAKRVTNSTAGLVAILDPFTATLVVQAADPELAWECPSLPGSGKTLAVFPEGSPLSALTSHVLATGKGFFTNDFRGHPLVQPLIKPQIKPESLIGRVLVIPFFTDRDPSGVLVFTSPVSEFSAADLLRGQEFSQAFGLAVVRAQLLTQMKMLETVFQRTPAAIAVTDHQGRVLSWNPGFESLVGSDKPAASCLPSGLLSPGQVPPAGLLAALAAGQDWTGHLPLPSGARLALVSPFTQEIRGRTLFIWVLPDPTTESSGPTEGRDDLLLRMRAVLPDFQQSLALIIGNVEMLQLSFSEPGTGQVETVRVIRGAVDRVWNLLNQLKSLCSKHVGNGKAAGKDPAQ